MDKHTLTLTAACLKVRNPGPLIYVVEAAFFVMQLQCFLIFILHVSDDAFPQILSDPS